MVSYKFLNNKHILLGVTGSIAAYKSADLVRRLKESGAQVRVVMTENAKRFITPLTMQAVSGHPIHDDLFDLAAEAAMGHIELAKWADLVLVAPASANFIAKLAEGSAGDILSTLVLATNAPIVIAPAMNQAMWQQEVTQQNCQRLKSKGIHVLGTNSGSQACGDIGPGRMLEPLDIVGKLKGFFVNDKLAGVRFLITAGPTQEAIDPVRFIMNGSSGKMGYALADAAIAAGASVTLVTGPVNLTPPNDAAVIRVKSTQEMYDAVMSEVGECDIFLGVAAVSDYRAKTIANEKITKSSAEMQLILEPNPDIIQEVGSLDPKPKLVIGFAAETNNVIANAKAKLARKKMDIIIANYVSEDIGIGMDDNEVTLITASEQRAFPLLAKTKLAQELMKIFADIYHVNCKEEIV